MSANGPAVVQESDCDRLSTGPPRAVPAGMSDPAPWYTLSTEAALARAQSRATGLTSAEAAARLAQSGPNELASAGQAIESLRRLAAPHAEVLRDGVAKKVPAREVVPGDVAQLHAGDYVPADGRLLEAFNLTTEEAALTGESLPLEKETEALAGVLPVGDRNNLVHAGTTVSYGRGTALVVATGMGTEFGGIAQLLTSVVTPQTPLQKNLDRLGSVLARVALGIVLVVVALGLFRGQPFLEMLLFGVALAVAVVPEALPAVVTISLALGLQRMAKRHAPIRRLPAVETLGSTSVICTDKTGTLTKDEMTMRKRGAQISAFGRAGGPPPAPRPPCARRRRRRPGCRTPSAARPTARPGPTAARRAFRR